MTILEAMDHPALFGAWFKGRTWAAWRAFLGSLFGLPLDAASLEVYCACTGRTSPPTSALREAWLIVGRRGGKSRVAALIASYLAALRDYREFLAPGERGVVLVLAADRKQAKVILGYVAAFFEKIPTLAELVESRNADSITLKSGVAIEVATTDYRLVRGRTVLACLCDEIAFWPADADAANPDKEIVAALRPAMLTIPTALLIGLSSPYAKRGVLYEAFRRHYGKDGSPVLVWKADTKTMNPAADAKLIAAAYEDDPTAADAEFGANFRSDVEAFLAREAVEAVVARGRLELPPLTEYQYAAFCDPSGGSQDAFTLAIAHGDGDRLVLDALRETLPPFSPEGVVEAYAETLKRYRVSSVTGDRYAGEWPREQFRKRGVFYQVADKPKSDLYKAFLPEVNSGRVELLDNARMIVQLAALERRTARGGRDTIDHPPNQHDDVANAAAGVIAHLAAVEPINLLDYGWINPGFVWGYDND